MTSSAISNLKSTGLNIGVSKIRELANRTMGTEGLIPLWFGEPDVPTPDFIMDAAEKSMRDGRTTYTEGLGKLWLREAISAYMTKLYGNSIETKRIAVTVSGTNAVNLAFQLLMEAGDRVVTTTPSFATLIAVPNLQNADLVTVPLKPSDNGWTLDVDRIIEEAKASKILLLNSPNNPTGFVLEHDDIARIMEACRANGTWIVSDEVYARIVYEGSAAPSFAQVAEPEDRVIIINSFSKSWAMTGWRLGWLTLPVSLLPHCEKLMEFSMSCSPEFVQAGGYAAITQGEAFIEEQLDRYREGRDVSLKRLSKMSSVNCIPPRAAFYVHFQVNGVNDNAGFAERMAKQAKVGIAPGCAFDPQMNDWFRICFAKDTATLNEAFDRMAHFMENGL